MAIDGVNGEVLDSENTIHTVYKRMQQLKSVNTVEYIREIPCPFVGFPQTLSNIYCYERETFSGNKHISGSEACVSHVFKPVNPDERLDYRFGCVSNKQAHYTPEDTIAIT
jgi:hypothetical protein